MRLLIEIVIAAALLAMAWQRSFKEWASEVPIIGSHVTASTESRKNPKATVPSLKSPTPPQSFTGHIYYTDEQGKSYWLDAAGKRHYQP